MNKTLELDIREVLGDHANIQSRLMRAYLDADNETVTGRMVRIMTAVEKAQAAEIYSLFSNRDEMKASQCESCDTWTFDGKCGCERQQQEALTCQLVGSLQWAHERGVE